MAALSRLGSALLSLPPLVHVAVDGFGRRRGGEGATGELKSSSFTHHVSAVGCPFQIEVSLNELAPLVDIAAEGWVEEEGEGGVGGYCGRWSSSPTHHVS